MKRCKNCVNRDNKAQCTCRERRKGWQWDEKPTVCEGCKNFGRYEPTDRGPCRAFVDSDENYGEQKS